MQLMEKQSGDAMAARRSGIAADIGISRPQAAAWEEFAETLNAMASPLAAIDERIGEPFAHRAPSLTETLHAQTDVLTTRLKATRVLQPITRTPFCALTPPQKSRANRLLPPIFRELLLREPH